MKNLELARILNNLADILELQEVEFKPRAYQKAALTIERLSESVDEIYKEQGIEGLEELPGVGESIARKIEEFIKTGKIKSYEQLKKEIKIDLEGLEQVPGLGPKTIKRLYAELKVRNLKDLEKAAKQEKIRQLKGMGEKEEKNILQGIRFIKAKPKRLLLGEAVPLAQEIKHALEKVPGVKRVEIAGSFRRGKETIGDLDILAISEQPVLVMDAFTSLQDIEKITSRGMTRSSIRLKSGLEIDLRVLKEKEFGSALLYFTGNKQHNIALRQLCLKRGYTLSEYGLFKLKGKRWVAGKTEKDVYDQLKLPHIAPELRENTGEIEAAINKKLPKLIEDKDILSDFHMHSVFSDGSNTIQEMLEQNIANKRKIIALTDHVGYTGITRSLNGKRFTEYIKEIDRLNKTSKIQILKGAEIDIDKKGKLMITDKMLKELDIVLGAVHSSFRLSEKDQTKRICSTLEAYPINILAHPLGRKINKREEMNINMDQLFECAKRTDTFLEVNGSLERMDLKDSYIKAGKEFGCKFSFGSDAHSTTGLEAIGFSLINARRGWLEKKDILNCWNTEKIRKVLRR